MQELPQFPELQEERPVCTALFVQQLPSQNRSTQRNPYVWCCQFFSLVYPCCPPCWQGLGLKSVGYLPESHPAVTERGARSKSKKGKIVAKRNDKASERGYKARGAEEEEVEYGKKMWWYGQNNKLSKSRTIYWCQRPREKTGQVKEGVRKGGQTEQEKLHAIRNYFKSTTFGYVIIVAQSNTRWSMHILDYIKDVNRRASTQTNTILWLLLLEHA